MLLTHFGLSSKPSWAKNRFLLHQHQSGTAVASLATRRLCAGNAGTVRAKYPIPSKSSGIRTRKTRVIAGRPPSYCCRTIALSLRRRHPSHNLVMYGKTRYPPALSYFCHPCSSSSKTAVRCRCFGVPEGPPARLQWTPSNYVQDFSAHISIHPVSSSSSLTSVNPPPGTERASISYLR